jgi:hypothetical protein
MRNNIQRRFLALHRAAKVSICVSEGMRAALGPHPNAPVVLPIPEGGEALASESLPSDPFRVCYLGNMHDYGPMLAGLAKTALTQSTIRLEFRGPEPLWPGDLKKTMREKGLLHQFAAVDKINSWLAGFHACLVAMFFGPGQRRRVETCFATKLVDYSALGKPIVIWAPESSAVVQWARKTSGALCVTDPSPERLLSALRELAADPQKQAALGAAARSAYESDFDPNQTQERFLEALRTALGNPQTNARP